MNQASAQDNRSVYTLQGAIAAAHAALAEFITADLAATSKPAPLTFAPLTSRLKSGNAGF